MKQKSWRIGPRGLSETSEEGREAVEQATCFLLEPESETEWKLLSLLEHLLPHLLEDQGQGYFFEVYQGAGFHVWTVWEPVGSFFFQALRRAACLGEFAGQVAGATHERGTGSYTLSAPEEVFAGPLADEVPFFDSSESPFWRG